MSATVHQRRTDMLTVWWASSFGGWGNGLAPLQAMGLDGHATEADINDAHRDLALIWHPDQAAIHRIGLARDFVLEMLGFSHFVPTEAPQDPEISEDESGEPGTEDDMTEDEKLWYAGSGSLWGAGFTPLQAMGLDGHSTLADLSKAFRRLAATWHPDKPCGSVVTMTRIGTARDIVAADLGRAHTTTEAYSPRTQWQPGPWHRPSST